MNLIKTVIGSVFVGAMSLLSTSCYNQEAKDCAQNRESLLEEIMTDKPQAELNGIKAGLSKGDARVTQMQHSIDSVVFRDMFAGTQLVQDSNFVADYNDMMARTKTPTQLNELVGGQTADMHRLDAILAEKVTVGELKNNPVLIENGGKGHFGTDRQYLIDSVYHHKLFEKHNLLNQKGLAKFKDLCRKVRP